MTEEEKQGEFHRGFNTCAIYVITFFFCYELGKALAQ